MKKHFLLSGLLFLIGQIYASISLTNLQTNYQTTPLGTDISIPQFSWQLDGDDDRRGTLQESYQIVVKDESDQEVWNSKKVRNSIAHAIQYEGQALQATTRYTWTVTVWDNFGNTASESSWFETGFLNPDISSWSGAKWIGGGDDDLVLYSDYLSVYKLQFIVQLDQTSNSTKASFLFGANDPRLMEEHLNFMRVKNGRDESYIALELDISQLQNGRTAQLNIYRAGYTLKDNPEVPFKRLSIPENIINQSNQYEEHQIIAECNFGIFEFFIDGHNEGHKIKDPEMEPTSRFGRGGLNLNPIGAGNDFISFPMLSEIGFKTGPDQQAAFSSVEIRNFRFPSNVLFSESLLQPNDESIFTNTDIKISAGQYLLPENTLVTVDPSHNAAPLLRREFNVENKAITKVRIYATARGIYELYLNGERISGDYFNPGLTQYNRTHMYQTYDITDLIQAGDNVVGAWLSEGWWSGNITYSGESWNYFGDRQSLLAKLVITYVDGSEQVITTDDQNWRLFTDGPIRYGSFFQGEVYDASKESSIEGWATPNYDVINWLEAVEVPLEGTAYMGTFTDARGRSSNFQYDQMQLIGQIGENATVVEELMSKEVTEVRPGVFVYDMGQNMVGIPQIAIPDGIPGQQVVMRYAEVKYPDLPDYQGNEGMVMMENIRAALAQDIYILKGGSEIIQPRFSFHGYRFIEISGIEDALPLENVKGLVISSVIELASHFETSHPLVNKLWENITWSLRSNFLSIPTDCPARNERMGWSGDISVFSKSATYLTDADLFLRKHMLAMRDMQAENGRFTDVAPVGGGFGGTLWGSAGIVVAWQTFRQYGDIQLLAEHYEAMKDYIHFLESKLDPETGILNEGPLGDWLSPEGSKNDNTLFWMSYFTYDLEIMGRAATILEKGADATYFKNKREEIVQTFNETYIDPGTHRTVKSGVQTGFMGPPGEERGDEPMDKGQFMDTQASYAIPLALDVFNEENRNYAINHLSECIQRQNLDDEGVQRPEFSLMTGFIGTASICQALSENGRDDLAYRLLVQEQYPSWLYSVVNGATTIWERLNSYTVEDGFGGNNSMNSFNHYSFGAVAAWMYQNVLGIQRHPEKAGFHEFVLEPTPDPNQIITSAKGYYDSSYGRISSEWQINNEGTEYKISIPENTQAHLFLPAQSIDQITENGQSITGWKGIKVEMDKIMIPLGSGEYLFKVSK